MRIAIATILRPTGPTGIQTHFRALKTGLAAKGHEVTLLTSFSYGRWLASLVYAVRPLFLHGPLRHLGVFWYRYWHYLFLYLALRRLVRAQDIDVVAAQCPLSAQAALKARRATGRNFKVVLTCHFNVSQAEEFVEKGELRKPSRLYAGIEALERQVLADVDRVVFVSRFAQEVVLEYAGLSRPQTHVVFNGLPSPTPTGKLRRSDLGLREGTFVIASVGTLEPRKNQFTLVRLLTEFLRSGNDCQLVLIGGGPDQQKIEEYVREKQLAEQVLLLGFRTDVNEILTLCDLYCHPSKMESLCIAVVEALSHGLPVIAAPVGGIPEFVEHERCGLLIDCAMDKQTTYVDAIRRLMSRDELYRRMSREATKVFDELLTVQAMTAKYEAIYQGIAESCPIVYPALAPDTWPDMAEV